MASCCRRDSLCSAVSLSNLCCWFVVSCCRRDSLCSGVSLSNLCCWFVVSCCRRDSLCSAVSEARLALSLSLRLLRRTSLSSADSEGLSLSLRLLRRTSLCSADSEALFFLSRSLLLRSLSSLLLCDSVSGDWERGRGESVVPCCDSECGDLERCRDDSMVSLSSTRDRSWQRSSKTTQLDHLFPMRSGRLYMYVRLRVAPRMRSSGERTDVYIYRDSASVESTRGGSLTLARLTLAPIMRHIFWICNFSKFHGNIFADALNVTPIEHNAPRKFGAIRYIPLPHLQTIHWHCGAGARGRSHAYIVQTCGLRMRSSPRIRLSHHL